MQAGQEKGSGRLHHKSKDSSSIHDLHNLPPHKTL